MQNPVATEAELKQGWAEREIEFSDGKRERIRIHALTYDELVAVANFCHPEILAVGIQKSLRVDREFVARICEASQRVISAMLPQLSARNTGGYDTFVPPTKTGNTLSHG